MPSTRCYGRACPSVGRRRCHSPKAGDGELQKAAPEASLIGPNGHRFPQHINGCKTSWRSRPRSPVCVCIRGYKYRSPPPACQYTGGPPPPPRGAEERIGCRASTGKHRFLQDTISSHLGVGFKEYQNKLGDSKASSEESVTKIQRQGGDSFCPAWFLLNTPMTTFYWGNTSLSFWEKC